MKNDATCVRTDGQARLRGTSSYCGAKSTNSLLTSAPPDEIHPQPNTMQSSLRLKYCFSFEYFSETTMLSQTLRMTGKRVTSRITVPAVAATRRGYHDNIIEHYENPRNVGALDKNDASVGTVSNQCVHNQRSLLNGWGKTNYSGGLLTPHPHYDSMYQTGTRRGPSLRRCYEAPD